VLQASLHHPQIGSVIDEVRRDRMPQHTCRIPGFAIADLGQESMLVEFTVNVALTDPEDLDRISPMTIAGLKHSTNMSLLNTSGPFIPGKRRSSKTTSGSNAAIRTVRGRHAAFHRC
jgi:hypothetical protein